MVGEARKERDLIFEEILADQYAADVLLAKHDQIAITWSIRDVQNVCPQLTDDQAWEVLQHVEKKYRDRITKNTLRREAKLLFPTQPAQPR